MPRKTVLALQDDNNRSRTQMYKDICGAYRNYGYTDPICSREPGAQSRAVSISGSTGVLKDSGVNYEEALDPLSIFKRRQERNTVTKSFLNESSYRATAQSMGMTVDSRGLPVNSGILSPSPKPSILQQTLQAAASPKSPNAPGPLMSACIQPRTPLPSPQFISMNQTLNRRPVFTPTSVVSA